jgi:hypothetical protein
LYEIIKTFQILETSHCLTCWGREIFNLLADQTISNLQYPHVPYIPYVILHITNKKYKSLSLKK